MLAINTLSQIFTYQGNSMPLVGAAFLSNVSRIFQVSPNGQGVVSYVPGSNFNTFTQLTYGMGYFVISKQVPYSIPENIPVDAPPTNAFVLTTDSAFSL